MATRLFFHDAASAVTGTLPSGENSTRATNMVLTGANTCRTMSTVTGTTQFSSVTVTASATLSNTSFLRIFATPTFDVDQVIVPQAWSLCLACYESSVSMNHAKGLTANVYTWNPAAGTVRSTIFDTPVFAGMTDISAFAEKVANGSYSSSATITVLAGDILVIELWSVFVQGSASLFLAAIAYDGTTVNEVGNTTVSNHAGFINLATSTLTFGTPSNSRSGSFANTLATVTLGATGAVAVAGTFSNTLGAAALAAAGAVAVNGTFSNTLGAATLAATGLVGASVGSFNNTLGAATLAAAGTVSVSGSFTNTLATVTLAATGAVVATGAFNKSLANATIVAAGSVTAGAVLPVATLVGSGAGHGAKVRRKFRVPENIPPSTMGVALHEILGVTPRESPENPYRDDVGGDGEPMTFTRLIMGSSRVTEPVQIAPPGATAMADDDEEDKLMIFLLQHV